MNMSGDAGSGGFTQIHSQVYAVGMIEASENILKLAGEFHHLLGGGSGEKLQAVDMGIRNDHNVAGGVGVGVEDDEAVLAAMKNTGFFIVAEVEKFAKNALFGVVGAADEGVAPRREEVVHKWEQYQKK